MLVLQWHTWQKDLDNTKKQPSKCRSAVVLMSFLVEMGSFYCAFTISTNTIQMIPVTTKCKINRIHLSSLSLICWKEMRPVKMNNNKNKCPDKVGGISCSGKALVTIRKTQYGRLMDTLQSICINPTIFTN